MTAHRWLERLAVAARIDQPITLELRKGHAAPCPSPADSLACLRMRSLPSPVGGGFFVPFLMALLQQTDALAADPPAALALANRTLQLHLPPPLLQTVQARSPEEATPDLTACLLARELTALQLGQPAQRARAFEGIHSELASRVAASARGAHNVQSNKELGLFLFSPLQMALSKATSPSHTNPLSQELLSSPHWLVLQRHAAPVAEAIGSFQTLPEEALKKAWPDLDGAFAMAAQDRLELVESQQRAAQEGALPLLAEAGLDPRPCAAYYQPAVVGARLDGATAIFERMRANPALAKRTLPRRFLPETNSVVIFPAAPR